jgi:cytosine permease
MMNNQKLDDFSRAPVTSDCLRPWWYLLVIELGVLISIPMFVIGGSLGYGLTLKNLILTTIAGGAILGVIGGLTARLGARVRCSTALIAKATFGAKGAVFIGILLALGMTGWWAVQTEMFANAVIELVQKLFHFNFSRELMIVLGGCAMITTAALGIKAIGRLAFLAVPLLVAGICYGLTSLLRVDGFAAACHYQPPVGSELSVGAAVATVVGGWIVGASMNPDYARFARNTKHAVTYALGHYSFNYPLLLIICGVMAIGFATKDVMLHLVPPHLTWVLLVLMMLATWAANDCNLYSSSLGLTVVLPQLKRSRLAICAGIVGITMAELRMTDHIVSFLVMLGICFSPIAGVFIVAGVDPRDPDRPNELKALPDWRIAPLLAWAGGVLVGFLTTPKDQLGLGLLQLTTIPTLDALLTASVLMLAIKHVSFWAMGPRPSRYNVPEVYNFTALELEELLSK